MNRSWFPINKPGIVPFFITAVITALVFGMSMKDLGGLIKDTGKRVKNAAIALLAGCAMGRS